MARQPSQFPVTSRTSSIGALTTGNEKSASRMSSREALSVSNRGQKAQKILGTGLISNQFGGSPSISSILGSKGEAEDFYHAMLPEPDLKALHELRVRASSPLLGQNYRANQPSFSSLQPETHQVRKSGSWSDLQSQRSALTSQALQTSLNNDRDELRGIGFSTGRTTGTDEKSQIGLKTKESKRKMRPSRIDLSLLFPRPKAAAAPLLSPQRYTNSPSPVASDCSSGKTKRFERSPSIVNKLTKGPSRSRSNSRKQSEAKIPEDEPLPPMPMERKAMDWFELPVDKVIRCAENDTVELPEVGDQPQKATTTSPLSENREVRKSKSQSEKISQQRTGNPKSSDIASKRVSSNTSSMSHSTESHLSPTPVAPYSSRIQNSLQAWQSDVDTRVISNLKKFPGKKSGSSTLINSDLTKSSVLSLSSSEDEDEDDEKLVKHRAPSGPLRDSVATYDDFEPEICTAKAVLATRGPALTRLDKTYSISSSESRRTPRIQSRSRNASLSSSTGRSLSSTKKRESRGSSSIPVIFEPDDFHEGIIPRQPIHGYSSSAKRRSRIIAVTRQEETLLEAMRERNGRITPSLFHELRRPSAHDSEAGATLLSPPPPPRSHDVAHNTNTSFLRLSSGWPSPAGMGIATDQGATSNEKSASVSLGTASDTEQRTDNSNPSPRVSLVYSDTHSSPSTTGYASPMTPTLPIHRFSPQAPPPSYAPPPVPDSSRRHSRRRTDSSEAIVLGDSEATKTAEPEYPLWAVKWSRDAADLAIVH